MGYALFSDDGQPITWGQFEWQSWEVYTTITKAAKVAVVERFVLYGSLANAQVNSEFVASQVIGVVRYLCWQRGIPLVFQPASEIHHTTVRPTRGGGSTRHTEINPLLKPLVDAIAPTGPHQRDAIAHALRLIRSGKAAEYIDTTGLPTSP